MNSIEVDGKVHEYAGSWNELGKSDVLMIGELYSQKLSEYDFKIRLLAHLTGLDIKLFRKMRLSDLFLATETLDFIFDMKKKRIAFDIQLTKNMIPKIKSFYGPADELSNFSFIEFINAHSAYHDYLLTGEESELNRLVAVLYRKPTFLKRNASDIRQKFDDSTVLDRSKAFEEVSLAIKMGVFFYFEGCMNYLSNEYPKLFKRSSEDDDDMDDYGFIGVLFDISGDKFGDSEKTSEQNLHTILSYLEYNISKQKQK